MADGNNSGGWGGWILLAVIVLGAGYLYQREGGKLFDPNAGPGNVLVDKTSIENVFKRDKELADWSRSELERNVNRVQLIEMKVKEMRKIDLSKCPSDFQAAYLKHVDAWSEMIPFVHKYSGPLGGLRAFAEGLDGRDDAEREYKQIGAKIRDTWTEVKRVALKYGVQPKE